MKTQRSRSAARTAVGTRGRRLPNTTDGRRHNYPLDVIVPTDTKTVSQPHRRVPPSPYPEPTTNCCYYPKHCSLCS